jgi:hypothetical protein
MAFSPNNASRLIPDGETNRKRIFQQLRAANVFKAPKVIQNWTVDFNGRAIRGAPENGFTALTSDDASLQIYLDQSAIGTTRTNGELAEKLSSFCGFDKGEEDGIDRKFLLLYILGESDQTYIDAMLDKNRVPVLISDADLAEEEERHKREQAQPRQSTVTLGAVPTQDTKGIKVSASTMGFASHAGMAALGSKFLPENIRVYTVRDGDVTARGDGSAFVYDRRYPGTAAPGNPYFVDPSRQAGTGSTPRLNNVHVMALGRGGLDPDSEKIAGLGEVFVRT